MSLFPDLLLLCFCSALLNYNILIKTALSDLHSVVCRTYRIHTVYRNIFLL